MAKLSPRRINEEIAKIVKRDSAGNFAPVDLSLEGVNKWRQSVGLPPLAKLPSEEEM